MRICYITHGIGILDRRCSSISEIFFLLREKVARSRVKNSGWRGKKERQGGKLGLSLKDENGEREKVGRTTKECLSFDYTRINRVWSDSRGSYIRSKRNRNWSRGKRTFVPPSLQCRGMFPRNYPRRKDLFRFSPAERSPEREGFFSSLKYTSAAPAEIL